MTRNPSPMWVQLQILICFVMFSVSVGPSVSLSCLLWVCVVCPAAARVQPGSAERPRHPQQAQSALLQRDRAGRGALQPGAQVTQHHPPWCGEHTLNHNHTLTNAPFLPERLCKDLQISTFILFFTSFFSQLEMRVRRRWLSWLDRNQVSDVMWAVM